MLFPKLQKSCVVQATLQFLCYCVLLSGQDVFITQPHNINFNINTSAVKAQKCYSATEKDSVLWKCLLDTVASLCPSFNCCLVSYKSNNVMTMTVMLWERTKLVYNIRNRLICLNSNIKKKLYLQFIKTPFLSWQCSLVEMLCTALHNQEHGQWELKKKKPSYLWL